MTPVKMQQAKADFAKLIARVEKGEEIVIARGDTPVAKLVPVVAQKEKSTGKLPVSSLLGVMKGKIFMPDNFFDPMTEEELALWEGPIEPPA